jgi:tetraprenyl-beta-curcumene synthase
VGQLTDIAFELIRFIREILPEAHRQQYIIEKKHEPCIPVFAGNNTAGSRTGTGRFSTEKLCSLMFSMLPGVEPVSYLSFMLLLYSMDEAIEDYRKRKDIRDELEIRKLMNCLSCAADPSRSLACDLRDPEKCNLRTGSEHGPVKVHTIPQCSAEQCRLHLAILPSFAQAASKIKKYMQLYIDLQSYRHYPAVISKDLLKTWSSNYIKRYQELSCWEFCACTDTFLGIAVMFAAACVRDISAEEIRLLDEACFPWLCGYISMLDSLIGSRASLGTDELNFSSFYQNLKECEDRLLFFGSKAEEAFLKLKDGNLYIRLMKLAASLYMTEREASFGMLRIAISNIIRRSTLQSYCNFTSLMRMLRFIK